jgi:hypothetical protein
MPFRFLCLSCARSYWVRLSNNVCPHCGCVPRRTELGIQAGILAIVAIGLVTTAAVVVADHFHMIP